MDARSYPYAVRLPGHEGIQLNAWIYEDQGPPLVFCHCTSTCGRTWDPVIECLPARFHPITLDARGHGDSDKPSGRSAYEWIKAGYDLLAAIDALGLKPGIWAAGHSGGGAHVAYAEYLRPGTFSKVFLLDPIIAPSNQHIGGEVLARKARLRRKSFPDRETARAQFASKPPLNRWTPQALDLYLAYGWATTAEGTIQLKCPGEVEAWMYELGGAQDVFEHLNDLAFDTLLVTGEESELAPLVDLQAQRLKNVRRATLARTGHFMPQENPVETAALLAHWFLDIHG